MKFILCFVVALCALCSVHASKSIVSKVVNPLPDSEPEAPEIETGGNFEGDIDMGPNGDSQGSNRNAIKDTRQMWPNGQVCYFFEDGAGVINPDIRERVAFAVQFISNVSCITLEEKAEPTEGCIKVTDKLGTGCFSNLGFVPSSWLASWGYDYQKINIPTWCQKGSAIHEFLHSLGFLHEQSRPDRDEHIRVEFDNIREGSSGNFRKASTDSVTTLDLPYDYGSIMHYGGWGFSINGEATIVPIPDSSVTIGQRKGMSELDIQKLNKHYNCPAKNVKPAGCGCKRVDGVPTRGFCTTAESDAACKEYFCAKSVCKNCSFC